jgi:hypothetical protein
LPFQIFHRGKNRLRLHHHPLPSTKRRIIDHVMLVSCPVAQVANVQLDDSLLLCAFHDTLAQRRAADFRKQGNDIDPHSEENVERPTPNVQRRIGRRDLLDNFEDSALAVARSRTSQQRANRLNRLAGPANHSADIPMSKLQLEDGSSAIWNFRQHHVIGKLNQLANHKLQKLPHALED